jgi:hypothetical protein
LEKISNTTTATVHHLVAALCPELGIKSEEKAATYLRVNAKLLVKDQLTWKGYSECKIGKNGN